MVVVPSPNLSESMHDAQNMTLYLSGPVDLCTDLLETPHVIDYVHKVNTDMQMTVYPACLSQQYCGAYGIVHALPGQVSHHNRMSVVVSHVIYSVHRIMSTAKSQIL